MSGRPEFTRRSLLVATALGGVAAAAGCTAEDPADRREAVTPAQVDQLAGQVTVQQRLVDAYGDALASAPELAASTAVLAEQSRAQLDRLTAASPGSAGTTRSGRDAVLVPGDPAALRAALRTVVGETAASHAAAAPGFTGARAALLGSIAAGLAGQEAQLA